MRLPEPTTEEILDKILAHQPQKSLAPMVLINTPALLSTVITIGVIWSQISALWLILAVPLAVLGWGLDSVAILKK